MHRGRGTGIDVQRSPLRVRHARRHQGRQPDHGRRHDPRWPVGLVRLLSHGRVRRVHRGKGRGQPGRIRTPLRTTATGRPIAATDAGKFKAEILPVQVPGKSRPRPWRPTKSPRRDTTAETLAKLKPAFRKDGGTVTAGNAPGLNDGASALVVTSLAFARAHGLEPHGAGHRVRHRRRRAARPLLRSGAGGAFADGKAGNPNRRLRSDRGQRGLCGAGAGRRARSWVGTGTGSTSTVARWRSAIRSVRAARECSRHCSTPFRDRGSSTGLATLCLGGGNAVALSVELI